MPMPRDVGAYWCGGAQPRVAIVSAWSLGPRRQLRGRAVTISFSLAQPMRVRELVIPPLSNVVLSSVRVGGYALRVGARGARLVRVRVVDGGPRASRRYRPRLMLRGFTS
jgi:hypothetical protein